MAPQESPPDYPPVDLLKMEHRCGCGSSYSPAQRGSLLTLRAFRAPIQLMLMSRVSAFHHDKDGEGASKQRSETDPSPASPPGHGTHLIPSAAPTGCAKDRPREPDGACK